MEGRPSDVRPCGTMEGRPTDVRPCGTMEGRLGGDEDENEDEVAREKSEARRVTASGLRRVMSVLLILLLDHKFRLQIIHFMRASRGDLLNRLSLAGLAVTLVLWRAAIDSGIRRDVEPEIEPARISRTEHLLELANEPAHSPA